MPRGSAPYGTHAGFGAWVGLVEMGVTFLLWQNALRRTAHAGRVAQGGEGVAEPGLGALVVPQALEFSGAVAFEGNPRSGRAGARSAMSTARPQGASACTVRSAVTRKWRRAVFRHRRTGALSRRIAGQARLRGSWQWLPSGFDRGQFRSQFVYGNDTLDDQVVRHGGDTPLRVARAVINFGAQ